MENIIKKSLVDNGICHDFNSICVINEYRNDKFPQVFKIVDQYENKIFKIRITANRKNAVEVEKTVCNILERNLQKHFFPRILGEYENLLLGNVLVMEYCPGNSLSRLITILDESEKLMIVNELIGYIQDIHSIKSEKYTTFGEVCYYQWADFYRNQMNVYLRGAREANLIDGKIVNIICKIIDHEKPQCVEPVLVYYDLKPDNIIFDRINSRVSLVDFEIARFVDPLMEISRGEFLCGLFGCNIYKDDIWLPFVEGITGRKYKDVVNDKKIRLYMLYHNLSYLNHIWMIEKQRDCDTLKKIQTIIDSLALKDY